MVVCAIDASRPRAADAVARWLEPLREAGLLVGEAEDLDEACAVAVVAGAVQRIFMIPLVFESG